MLRFLLALLLSGTAASAQYLNIRVSPAFGAGQPNEPSINFNPHDPSQMIAGANINRVYRSDDSGQTWLPAVLGSQYGVWGDPVIEVDTAGTFYYFHLSNPNGTGWGSPDFIDRIVCQKYDWVADAWTAGTFTGLNTPKKQDKHWTAVDPRNNTIYVTWTQFDVYGSYNPADSSNILFSKSTDAGATWSTPLRLNARAGDCIDSSNTVEGAVPCVGPNGEVYVAWTGPAGIRFDRSLDGGATWLASDILVDPQPGGWDQFIPGVDRANGFPFTACDRTTSLHRGTIYINWTDQRSGTTNTDVWLAKSTDGGTTWSAPLRVNDDAPGLSGKHQFFTSMALDQATGYLYILFYDRRAYADNRTDVYLARSTDGGATFTNTRISTSSFLPFSTVFFGDYTDIAAHGGIVRPVWTRMDGGNTSIWTALVNDPDGIAAGVGNVSPFVEEGAAYPNPFEETAYFSYKLRRPAVVDVWVADVYGRRVATLRDNEALPMGKYTEHFDATTLGLPRGMYLFCLRSGGAVKTQRIVYRGE